MNIEYARQQMVEQQVRAWDVLNTDVLDVLAALSREHFVPPGYERMAFADVEIPIGYGEAMLTPTIEGRILQALELAATDRVLEVGTGTGFLSACLATMAASVTSLEIHEALLTKAARNLDDAGFSTVELLIMDAMRELPGHRYDAIAIGGSMESFDPRFVEALNPGGRLFVVVGSRPIMDARLVRKTGDHDWQSESLFETRVKPLVNGTLPAQFTF